MAEQQKTITYIIKHETGATEDQIKEAYQSGFIDGKMDAESATKNSAYDAGYDDALHDLWESVRKVCGSVDSGGYPNEVVYEIFGKDLFGIFEDLSVDEFISLLNDYKDKQAADDTPITAGDQVVDCSGNICIVTNTSKAIHVIYPNGKTHKWPKTARFTRTGNRVDTFDVAP